MKISEILKEAKQYHYAFGGSCTGMCAAVSEYTDRGIIYNAQEALDFCRELVEAINKPSVYLSRALYSEGLPHNQNIIAMIWDAVIDKLEYDGK